MFKRNRFAPSTDTTADWNPHHRHGTRPAESLVTVRSDESETMTERADALAWDCDEPGGRIVAWRAASAAEAVDYLRDAEPFNTADRTVNAGAWVPYGGDCRPVGADTAVEIFAASGETLSGLAGQFAWRQSVPVEGRIVKWRPVAASAIVSGMC